MWPSFSVMWLYGWYLWLQFSSFFMVSKHCGWVFQSCDSMVDLVFEFSWLVSIVAEFFSHVTACGCSFRVFSWLVSTVAEFFSHVTAFSSLFMVGKHCGRVFSCLVSIVALVLTQCWFSWLKLPYLDAYQDHYPFWPPNCFTIMDKF